MWQRLCVRCKTILQKKNSSDVLVCPKCGWIWGK